MTDVRLGLIGAGPWGRRYIATIDSMSGVNLVLVASRNPETESLVPETPVVPDWRDLLPAGLDGVVIATPPASHGEILRAFVGAGIPAMVEKPLCLGLSEALELRDIVAESGVPVLVDHTQLFNPAFVALKTRAQALGAVRFIRSESMGFGPFRPDVSGLWDRAPHDISVCLDLLAAVPDRVCALGNGAAATLWLDFHGGPSAWIANSNLSMQKTRALTVHFERCVLVFDDVAADKLVEHRVDFTPERVHHPALGPGDVLPVPEGMPLTRAVEHFVRGVRRVDLTGFGLDLACEVIRVIDAAQRSMRDGRPQSILAQVTHDRRLRPQSSGAAPHVLL